MFLKESLSFSLNANRAPQLKSSLDGSLLEMDMQLSKLHLAFMLLSVFLFASCEA